MVPVRSLSSQTLSICAVLPASVTAVVVSVARSGTTWSAPIAKKFSGLRPAGKKFGAIATGNVIKRFYDEWIVEQNGGNTGQIGQEASAMKYIDQRLKETGQIKQDSDCRDRQGSARWFGRNLRGAA